MRDPLIYALTDVAGAVRYIGKSVNGLARARKHSQPAQLKRKCHRSSWLKGLISAGQCAGIVVLERFADPKDLNDAECYWIAQGRGLGWALTNHTAGGDGNAFPFGNTYAKGNYRSPELRARQSAAHRILWADPEFRERTIRNQRANASRGPAHSAAVKKGWETRRTKARSNTGGTL